MRATRTATRLLRPREGGPAARRLTDDVDALELGEAEGPGVARR